MLKSRLRWNLGRRGGSKLDRLMMGLLLLLFLYRMCWSSCGLSITSPKKGIGFDLVLYILHTHVLSIVFLIPKHLGAYLVT